MNWENWSKSEKKKKQNLYLVSRNRPSGIIHSNHPYNFSNSRTVISTPRKVKARQFGVVLFLARRNCRGHQRSRVCITFKRRRRPVPRLDGFLDKENEGNEEERREELEECGALVPPWEQEILEEQSFVLLY